MGGCLPGQVCQLFCKQYRQSVGGLPDIQCYGILMQGHARYNNYYTELLSMHSGSHNALMCSYACMTDSMTCFSSVCWGQRSWRSTFSQADHLALKASKLVMWCRGLFGGCEEENLVIVIIIYGMLHCSSWPPMTMDVCNYCCRTDISARDWCRNG